MENSAYIRDINSLEQLGIAIARFCEENETLLHAIDFAVQSKLAELQSFESRFLRQVALARDDLHEAKSALSACESNVYVDEEGNVIHPDCCSEREEVRRCKDRLEAAELTHDQFRRAIRDVKHSIADFQRPRVKYKSLIQFRKEAAISSLNQLISGAQDYLSVTSPCGNMSSYDLGLTEVTAKLDPIVIVAANVGIAEIATMCSFSFLSFSGKVISVTNTIKKGLVTSAVSEKGRDYICSELRIEEKKTGRHGTILSVNIPPPLQGEKVERHLVSNMEAICRANGCNEISGWANSANVDFYQQMNYQTRNEIKGAGAEVVKLLDSSFPNRQKEARDAFESVKETDFIRHKKLGTQQVHPLDIISPDGINDEAFWRHHGSDQARYVDLIEKYARCLQELESGKSLDEVRTEDVWVANAYDVFHGSDPIRLQKSGKYYRVDENGRHRVAAAQIYFFRTGSTVPIAANVIEKQSS